MEILIVKTSAIGDVTHTLPALEALRRFYPHSRITWLVEDAAADIVMGHPALDRVLVSGRKRWVRGVKGADRWATLREIGRFVRDLRDTEYDLVIDFQNLLKSGIWVGLARGRRKVGFGPGMAHSEFSYIFLNERIPAVDMEHHAADRELMLLEAIGIECKDIPYRLPLNENDRKAAFDLLKSLGVTSSAHRRIAINPVAKWETKGWEPTRFAELADRLAEAYDVEILFTGSAEDRKVVENIRKCMQHPAVDLTGKTRLRTLAAVFETVRLVVTTDTGPMHIAAAVGTPVVALFGPTAPWRTGPVGPAHRIVRTGIQCSPCYKRKCPRPICMEKIDVDRVMEAVRSVTGWK